MRVDDLGIALRARSAWEATDLGLAMVRAYAGRIFGAWLVVTLPVWLLLNVLAGLLDRLWLAPLLMWWLKPAFDRSVLFVLSRSVFGAAPNLRATLAAQRSWGWRGIAPWLLWRRLHPARALLLPVDLLEGVRGEHRHQRASVLGRGDGSTAIMLTFIGANLEMMLYFSLIALALMFVPVEFFDESAKAMLQTLFVAPPAWAQAVLNLVMWLATSIIEPFYVGAGFGLYLNRRMQLEAWDIELAFRRIAARLAAGGAALALVLALVLGAGPVVAQAVPPSTADAQAAAPTAAAASTPTAERPSGEAADHAPAPPLAPAAATAVPHEGAATASRSEPPVRTGRDIFGARWRDDGGAFADGVREAYAGDDLGRTRREFTWKERNSGKPEDARAASRWAATLGTAIGFLFKYGLWIIAALVVAVLVSNWRRWLPQLTAQRHAAEPDAAPTVHDLDAATPLPADIVAAVRQLLAAGRMRDAMALFYRAAVARLVQVQGAPLPPGATEALCLRHARALADSRYAGLFAGIVRAWQAVAYAQRPPSPEAIEALLLQWQQPPRSAASEPT